MLADDLKMVRGTYRRIFELENEYRGGHFNLTGALEDTFGASLCLCSHRVKGIPDNPIALALVDGAERLTSHLVDCRFHLDIAKVAAAKTGLLTRLIAKEDTNPSLSFWRNMPNVEDLRPLKIDGDWERLNRLKSTSPEAFYYCYQASRL